MDGRQKAFFLSPHASTKSILSVADQRRQQERCAAGNVRLFDYGEAAAYMISMGSASGLRVKPAQYGGTYADSWHTAHRPPGTATSAAQGEAGKSVEK